MSDEIGHARVGCGPVGAGLVAVILGICVLLTIGSGLVVLFPGPVVDLFDQDDDEPDRLRADLGPDGTPTIQPDRSEPLGSASNPAVVGAEVDGDGVAVTLQGVTRAATVAETPPEAGYVFLILDVTIANVSDEAKEFGAYFWSARDVVAEENFDDEKNIRPGNALLAGSLAAGDQVRGNVLLVVRDGATVIRVKYDTALIGGDNLYWLYTPGAAAATGTPATVSSPVATP